ncbi:MULTISPECIES: hypothetical protein [Streptosporangium]|uniref:S-DNA-T family DNA segregation ATPase FtsK/SpoIIIE n=1 Tax=Streptosporangium brasiliense TaxID=47480 RepID=A0ABT9RME7_9ACTN|nr:hypothetical protein [Streptosporangium brasiliense]MDP9870474.1 S-DNA-T family DNA segregation ATPase FtsK/SpoIIIE [Streptosporangium brasiliense]
MVGTKTKATTKQPVDWSLTPRGPVSAAVQGSLALAAAATVGDAVALSPVWGGAATAAGALALVVAGAHRQLAPAALLYRLGCWVGAGAWWTWTLVDTPWSQSSWAALGIGAMTAGLMAPLGRVTKKTKARPGSALVLRSTSGLAADWEARIRRVCRAPVIVTDVRAWDNGAGYDVLVTLPPSGVTRADIAGRAESLATAADLPEGCSVEVRGVAGAGRSQVMVRVSTVNRIAQVIGYPADYSPRSILEPIVLGEHANSDVAGAEVREEAALIAGKRGSGKTTLLQVVSIALGRCRDNLVWHLDLNGGGLTQPWIDVWLDGRAARCPIDWAAPNLAEGKLMLASAISIAKHRKASYRKLKRAHNASLLPVSADLPQITIVVDEGANAVADRDLAKLLGELQNIGRNEAVNLVISSLRPTGDLVPVNMRKQSGVRVQMYGPDPEELAHMFGWSVNGKLSMDQLGGKGTGFLSLDGSFPRPFRGYNVLPAQVEDAALAIAALRPDLDAASAQAAGPAYASRLERMRRVFADRDGQDDELETSASTLPAPQTPPRRLTVLPGGANASEWADPPTLAGRTRPAVSTASAADWPEPRMVGRLRAEQMHPVPAAAPAAAVRPVPQIVTRALATIDDAGDDRMHSATLAEALGLTPTDLAALLRPLGVTTLPRAFLRGGREARGYAREDLSVAAERIGRGEIDVPADVAAWPAA